MKVGEEYGGVHVFIFGCIVLLLCFSRPVDHGNDEKPPLQYKRLCFKNSMLQILEPFASEILVELVDGEPRCETLVKRGKALPAKPPFNGASLREGRDERRAKEQVRIEIEEGGKKRERKKVERN
ncbi:hypothetical protein HOY82DRAFT_614750 [Tuber indicum]|nr:hypothetical protein HOY82DRAFT_614750 [Tuber indicum]